MQRARRSQRKATRVVIVQLIEDLECFVKSPSAVRMRGSEQVTFLGSQMPQSSKTQATFLDSHSTVSSTAASPFAPETGAANISYVFILSFVSKFIWQVITLKRWKKRGSWDNVTNVSFFLKTVETCSVDTCVF